MASIKIACVVLICMVVVGAPIAQSTITCEQVISTVVPCLTYLKSGGAVPEACCYGVQGLLALAQSTDDKRTACKCLRDVAASTLFIPENAKSLSGKCGVNIPYMISAYMINASTNCDSITF